MSADANASVLKCSFCDKSQEEVTKLVAGPGVYICDQCIRLGYDLVSDDQGPPSDIGRPMPPFARFSPQAQTAMVEAQQAARELRHKFLGTEHILLGVLAVADGELAELFATRGVQTLQVREQVMELVGPSEGPLVGAPPFTPRALQSLQLAGTQAAELAHERVDAAHLVLGLLAEGRGLAAQLLHAAGIGEAEVLAITSAR